MTMKKPKWSFWHSLKPNTTLKTLAVFVQPELKNLPRTWQKWLQPLVGFVAGIVLLLLLGTGLYGFSVFLFASALIYFVLTQIFGLHFEMRF